ncbi:MAG TPA: addiction module protein [Longimicrobium sp.]|nr:addiction module protein [Longimicrobium sp.]
MSVALPAHEVAAAEAESIVMQLPPEERGRIAARLLESLKPDPRHDAAWAAEIRERIRAVEAGEMKLITEEEADAEVEELLR